GLAAGDGKLRVGRQRLGEEVEGFAKCANGLGGSGWGSRDAEVEAEVSLAWDADFPTHKPVDDGVEMDGAGLDRAGSGQLNRKGNFIFVAKVHERAERKATGDRKLHWSGSDAVGKSPGDLRWFPGVAGVDPVDMPVFFEGEDE